VVKKVAQRIEKEVRDNAIKTVRRGLVECLQKSSFSQDAKTRSPRRPFPGIDCG
jgi:hypothetical protein